MNTPGYVSSSAYGVNGPLTEVMKYRVDGKLIYETLDIDLNSPTYGQAVSVQTKKSGQGPARFVDVSPNSELGLAVAADQNSVRQTAYLNKMQDIGFKAEQNNRASFHNDALEKSGMYDMATGDKPYNVEIPAVEYTIEGGEGDQSDEKKAEVKAEEAKTETIKDKKMQNVTLQYPSDAEYTKRNGQDHLYIEQFAYVPSQKKTAGVEGKSVPNMGGSVSLLKGFQRGSNIVDPDTRKTEAFGRVLLPIPNKLLASNGVSWGEGRANTLEAGAFFAADDAIKGLLTGDNNIGDVLSSATKGGLGLLGKVQEDLKKKKGNSEIGTVLSSVLAKLALSKAGLNVDPAQFITRSQGKAINPNLELLFNGPKLRNFTFGFQFAPNNVDEAAEIRRIMRFFKQGMLPKGGGRGGNNIFLGSPNVFRLKYRSGKQRIKALNMFKICALTAVEFDYTPDNVYQSYDDPSAISQPVRTSMALSFTELTPIFEGDYSAYDKSESIRDLSASIDENDRFDGLSDDDIGF